MRTLEDRVNTKGNKFKDLSCGSAKYFVFDRTELSI